MRIEKFINSSPSFQIIAASQRIQRSIHAIATERNLSFLQAMILLTVFFEQGEPIQPKRLAEALQTTKSNLSHSLAILESGKMIKRSSDPADARRCQIQLSEKGKNTALRLIGYFDEMQKRTEALLGEAGALRLVKKIEGVKELYERGAPAAGGFR